MDNERWKQAVEAGSNNRNYRRERGFTETRDDAFVDGVQWADEHPRKGLVDLDNVWHDARKENPNDRDLLIVNIPDKDFEINSYHIGSYFGSTGYFSSGGWVKEWDFISEWAYVNDLLPKRLKKE